LANLAATETSPNPATVLFVCFTALYGWLVLRPSG
jgi:hypothetical protein